MKRIVFALLAPVLTSCVSSAVFAQASDAAAGQRLYQQRCGACHQIATPRNGFGPHLQGVIGRAAGTVQGFNYSPALRDSGITWNAVTLETYLANPTEMVRGTRMIQRFNNADERREIIEFLSTN